MIYLLHGFLGSPKDWSSFSFQTPHLPLTLPGHGRKAPFISNPSKWLSEEILSPSVLIGYSLGGRLALQFAFLFPHLIQKLILLSTNPGIEDQNARKKRLLKDKKWVEMIDKEGFKSFLETWYCQDLFSNFKKDPSFPFFFKKRLRHNPKAMQRILLELSPAKMPSFWKALKKSSFPILFLFGENDIRYKQIHDRLKKLGVKTDLIKETTHAIHLENPNKCLEKIKEFL